MTELKKRFFDETQFAPLFNLESSDSSVLVEGVNLPEAIDSQKTLERNGGKTSRASRYRFSDPLLDLHNFFRKRWLRGKASNDTVCSNSL